LKDNDPKREQLLAAAKALFWKHGIRRISIEEICREAGISRMTFYKHFRDKNSIILTILEELAKEGLERYQGIMKSDAPFPEKVKALIRFKSEEADSLSHEFYHDIHQHAGPAVVELLDRMDRDSIRLFEKDIVQAQKQGHLRAGIHPKFFVYLLDKLIEMSHDENLIGMYPSLQAMIVELTNFYFYGILPADGRDANPKPRSGLRAVSR
jgi:AcrR family transcriptional regulator